MKKLLITGFMLASLYSCDDYLDVNSDQQNNPELENIAPKQMLGNVLVQYAQHQNTTLSDFGNRMAYAWGLNSGFTSSDPAYDHNFNSSSYNGLFNTTYLIADDLQDIIDKEVNFPQYAHHIAIAKIFKVMSMDYLTALYGDVPYSEAFKPNNKFPKYDDDKDIIPKLFAELDQARAQLQDSHAVELGAEDIVFHGDLAKWEQFLNTIELRLALRLSKTTNASLVALRNNRFASLSDNFITEDVNYNPGFTNNVGFRNPIYTLWGLNDAQDNFTSSNRAMAAGDFAAKLVNGTLNDVNITTGIVDPRRSRIFTLVSGSVKGNVHGDFPLTGISRFANFYIGRGGSGEKNGTERDGYLMLAAEAYFLKAEAIQRGFMAGDAQTEFNNGITASFTFYNRAWGDVAVSAMPMTAVDYISAIDSKNGLGWNASTDKISAISTQKYLALANWSGMELYLQHLRTGFPKVGLPVGVNQSNKPLRMPYPSREYSTNSANVPSLTLDELFTVNAKTPYYLQ